MGYAVDAKNRNDVVEAFWTLLKPLSADVRETLGHRLLSSVNKAKDVQMNPIEEGLAGHVTPFVMSLGVDMNLSADYDEKAEYQKYLEQKYR